MANDFMFLAVVFASFIAYVAIASCAMRRLKSRIKAAPKCDWDALPQANANHRVNAIVRMFLERLKEKLEKETGEQYIIGTKRPSDFMDHEAPNCPVHFEASYGFLLCYLARPEADHEYGPIIETDKTRQASWILCMSPNGLWIDIELFEMSLKEKILCILKDSAEGMLTACTVTENEVYPKAKGPLRGEIRWMIHRILPLPPLLREVA